MFDKDDECEITFKPVMTCPECGGTDMFVIPIDYIEGYGISCEYILNCSECRIYVNAFCYGTWDLYEDEE